MPNPNTPRACRLAHGPDSNMNSTHTVNDAGGDMSEISDLWDGILTDMGLA